MTCFFIRTVSLMKEAAWISVKQALPETLAFSQRPSRSAYLIVHVVEERCDGPIFPFDQDFAMLQRRSGGRWDDLPLGVGARRPR